MRKLVFFIFYILFFIFSPKLAMAANLDVSCNGSDCTVNPGGQAALFNETKFLPGQSATRTINAFNNGPDDCNLLLDTKNETDAGNMAETLFTVIKSGGTDLFGVSDGAKASSNKNLANVYSAGWVNLGTVGVGTTKAYDWTVTMNPLAGNEYQGRETIFDFDLNFSCGVPPGPSNPSNPSNPSAPTCSDVTPQAPSGLTATSGGIGQVILSWFPPSTGPYTYFLITYSDNPSWPPKWGNPNVGNVTSYTVSGLGTGSYWFWVRAGNGCQPGPYIGPVAITIIGIPGVVGPAEGFSPGVLGEQENLSSGVATQAAEIQEVRGAATCECIWWPILLGGIIAQVLYLVVGRLRKKKYKLIPWMIALITFAVFWFYNRNCSWIEWPCRWFWSLDLIICLLTALLGRRFLRNE